MMSDAEIDILHRLTSLERRLDQIYNQVLMGWTAESKLTAAAASVTFYNIPQNYSALQLTIYARSDRAAVANDTLNLRLNLDAGANYDFNTPYISDTTITGNIAVAATAIGLGYIPAATATAGVFDSYSIVIPSYAETTGQKSVTGTGTLKTGTATANLFIFAISGWWRSTAAITSVRLLPGAGNFIAGSIFNLCAIS